MKKILIIIAILASSLSAQLQEVLVTKSFLDKNKNIKIIDIRTPSEWKETGIIKGSHTIMFFNERGQYNINKFVSDVNKIVKKGEKFAIICRTGSRTATIAPYLSDKLHYNIINLKGGITKLIREGYKTTPYRH
ncbi:rhodanese-like domain protein [hydrothermal vent metagenome]|uniref:Rhodanese-like domain protein n=1 Tax=hydrothermal vent metagenome TaxID=652676 RepID=A0A1W1C8K2_9ZZZZ